MAKKLDGPILLTKNNKIEDKTLAEIERLGASKVVILGGEAAISTDVMER
ncbi:cell wall-binding repeat-containing protein [Sutcliffiella horikoshii]|nr:cell wall-binding repeat-containing protein [Sutcliffiella horikoshii]